MQYFLMSVSMYQRIHIETVFACYYHSFCSNWPSRDTFLTGFQWNRWGTKSIVHVLRVRELESLVKNPSLCFHDSVSVLSCSGRIVTLHTLHDSRLDTAKCCKISGMFSSKGPDESKTLTKTHAHTYPTQHG